MMAAQGFEMQLSGTLGQGELRDGAKDFLTNDGLMLRNVLLTAKKCGLCFPAHFCSVASN